MMSSASRAPAGSWKQWSCWLLSATGPPGPAVRVAGARVVGWPAHFNPVRSSTWLIQTATRRCGRGASPTMVSMLQTLGRDHHSLGHFRSPQSRREAGGLGDPCCRPQHPAPAEAVPGAGGVTGGRTGPKGVHRLTRSQVTLPLAPRRLTATFRM